MSKLTDDEMLELDNIAEAFLPSRGWDLFGDAMAELKERRAADLNAEDREALAWLRRMLAGAHYSSYNDEIAKQHGCALVALDRLLNGGK